MRVAVAGGTGVVGVEVVDRLTELGHEPVVLARSRGTDLTSGAGIEEALTGVHAVVDATSIASSSRTACVEFFTTVTRTLLRGEDAAGVGHHVVLSIVGIDDVPFGYYQGKVAHEQAVMAGSVPWSILRATQFHEFPGQMLERTSVGPVSFVPRMRSQPVAAAEVARALVDLALGEPAGRVADLAGPREEQMVELARRLVRHRGERRRVVGVPVPGAAGRAMRDGGLLPTGPGPRGTQTFDDWLARSD